MSDKGIDKKKVENEEEKVLYSTSKIVCFACGEQIDKETKVCPNCKTTVT